MSSPGRSQPSCRPSAPSAVVVGGHVNGLGLARALSARGVRVAVVTSRLYDIAQHSRACAEWRHAPEVHEHPEALVELLEREASSWCGAAIFPTHDDALEAVARHHARLARSYRLTSAPWEVTRHLIDKRLTRALADAVGVEQPRCFGPATAETSRDPDIVFPVLVKPVLGHRFFSHFGTKLFFAPDRAALVDAVARVGAAGLDADVVEWIPGGDEAVRAYGVYVDASGRAGPGVAIRKRRQAPPFFGVTRVAELAPTSPSLRELAVALLERVGFRGAAAIEFKIDPRDGRPRLVEINGRSILPHGLFRAAGLDLAWDAYLEAVRGEPPQSVVHDFAGVWIHLHTDLLYSALFHRSEGLTWGRFVAPYRRTPRIFAVWSARDPRPFVTQWAATLREATALVGRRGRRRLSARVQPLDST